MPFPVPGVAENTERQLRDIANALPGETIDTGADSDYRIRANAVSGVADGLYMHQGWILRQVFPDTADPEYLELHCRTRNVFRKKATASSGPVVITGTPGKTLPAGAEIRGEGVSVTTTTDCTVGDEGSAEVTVKSTATGAQTNASTTQTATLVSPPEGINSTVTIKSLTGGTDR
ncbi:TPA: baseplate J/gp47 family protein, partial [Escherichia coli]|nr:baseplate J/gp47 family protein [Escherichia coli]